MKNLGLYIHIPFCRRKCFYCDFVSFSDMDAVFDEYIDALIAEMRLYSEYLNTRTVDTVFIGGGTPSLLSADQIVKLMHGIQETCNFSPSEVSIEANPESLTKDKLAAYAGCGIDRLSIGLQAHDDAVLAAIGRLHTYEDFVAAYETAQKYLRNINIDTMFALPDQTTAVFEETMRRVIALGPSHVSSYALKLEQGTPLESTFEGVDDETDREMYHLAVELLTDAGYTHYETSNFARPGAECVHNLKYWTGGQYLGIGVAAHSYTDDGSKTRHSNVCGISEYLLAVADGIKPIAESLRLSNADVIAEYIMLHLRLAQGIELAEFNKIFDADFQNHFAEAIETTHSAGLVSIKDGHIKPTLAGFDLQNTLIGEFLKER